MHGYSRKTIAIIVAIIIIAVIILSLLIVLPIALDEKKAIIILPGLIASGLLDDLTGQPIWAPFNTDYVLGDFFDPAVSTKMIFSLALQAMSGGENSILSQIVNKNENSIIKKLHCDEDGNPIYPHIVPATMDYEGNQKYGALQAYRDIYEDLEARYGAEYEVIVFNYDWRMDNRKSAEKLEKFINDNQYEKVIIASHSMGNLVATNYFARSQANRDKVIGHISLAAPYYGSMMALTVLETLDNLIFDIVGELPDMIKNSLMDVAEDQFLPLASNLTTVYQLLPMIELVATPQVESSILKVDGVSITTREELIDFYKSREWAKKSDGSIRKAVSELEEYWDSFLVETNGQKVHASTLVNTLYCAGNDFRTENVANITNGIMSSVEVSYEGDGTVQLYSALLGNSKDAQNVLIVNNCDHFGCGNSFDDILEKAVYDFIDAIE